MSTGNIGLAYELVEGRHQFPVVVPVLTVGLEHREGQDMDLLLPQPLPGKGYDLLFLYELDYIRFPLVPCVADMGARFDIVKKNLCGGFRPCGLRLIRQPSSYFFIERLCSSLVYILAFESKGGPAGASVFGVIPLLSPDDD